MAVDAVAAVLAELERDEAFLIGLTRQLVRIPTVNPKFEADPAINREAELQRQLQGTLDEIGMRTECYDVFPGRPNLTGTLPGSEERSLILCGHVDVVPVGDRAAWTADPFGGEVRGRRLYGRGAIDMKSGVAAAVAVARAIHRAGVALDGRLEIHAVVDEEAGGFGARDLVQRGRHAAGLIVTEPTWQTVQPAEGGLEWVRVTIRGRNAHSAWRYNEIYPQPDQPGRLEPGVNALEIAARFIGAVQLLERDWTTRKRPHKLLPPGMNTDPSRRDGLRLGHGAERHAAAPDEPRHHPGCRGDRLRPEIPARREFRRHQAGVRGVRARLRPSRTAGFASIRRSCSGISTACTSRR